MIIGFFDISLDLLTLFKKTAQDFPMHDYIFYIDTLNASSYQGEKDRKSEDYIAQGMDYLIGKNCSVLVIGNTIPIAYFQNYQRTKRSKTMLIAPNDLAAFLKKETYQPCDEIGIRTVHLTKHSKETDLQIAKLLQGSFLPH